MCVELWNTDKYRKMAREAIDHQEKVLVDIQKLKGKNTGQSHANTAQKIVKIRYFQKSHKCETKSSVMYRCVQHCLGCPNVESGRPKLNTVLS